MVTRFNGAKQFVVFLLIWVNIIRAVVLIYNTTTLVFYNAISNLLGMLRIGDLANIYWFIFGVIVALSWIMLAVFVGMLANKLK